MRNAEEKIINAINNNFSVNFNESGSISINGAKFKKDEINDFTKIFQAVKEYFSKHPEEFGLSDFPLCKNSYQEGGFW